VVYYLCFGHYDYQFSTITILSTKPTTAIKKFKTRQAAVSKHPSHKLDRFGQCNAMEMEAFSTRPSPVAAGRGKWVHATGAKLCRGGIWRGENMEFWNLAASGELMLALQNGFGGNLHYVTPP